MPKIIYLRPMLKFFPQWIKRLITLGIDDLTSETEADRITMTNIFNLFSVGGFSVFIVIMCFYKWWLIVAVEFAFVLLFATSLLLNHLKKYNWSRFLFLSSFCGFVLFFGWLDYRHTVSVYYYLFALPLMIFVLFDTTQITQIVISLVAVIVTYFLINEIEAPFYLRRHNINDADERGMHLLNVAIIFSIISFIAFRFANMYHQKNVALIIKQKQLLDNHSLAKAGSWYYSIRLNIFKYSDEMKEIFGTLQSVKKLRPDYFLNFLSAEDKERFNQNRIKALKNKVSVEDDYEIHLKNGTSKFIVAVIQPVLELNKQVRGLQGVCIDVTEERRAELFLKENLHESEVLLDEIHHRIDYNLSLIKGFVQLQMLKTNDGYVREMLDVCRQRISTMSLIHEKMFTSNFNSTFFDDYLLELIANIRISIESDSPKVAVITQLESVLLDYNNVLPCGLIINELMSNSYKHAFKGRSEGTITITMKKEDNNIIVNYSDDGCGFNEMDHNTGIGMDLIYSLTQQLKGTIEIKNQNGFNCSIKFNAKRD